MIPQLQKLSNDFFQNIPTKHCLKKDNKKDTRIRHRARKKDMMAQLYGTYVFTGGTYHVRFTLHYTLCVAGNKAY